MTNDKENITLEHTTIQQVSTIKEIRESETSGLTYAITAQVKRIYRNEGGLTIFTISDGAETFRLISFAKGGNPYGEIKEGSMAEFNVKRRSYENELQGTIVEAKLAPISSKTRQLKKQLLIEEYKKYAPEKTELLLDTMNFEKLQTSFIEAATLIRGAIKTGRPILVTHHADTDGFCAALQVERAIKDLLDKQYSDLRFIQNYYIRNPSKTPFYDVTDATRDIAFFQINSQRTQAPAPLILILDNGSTEQDLLSIQKTALFEADVIVVDHHDPGKLDENGQSVICKETLTHINPHLHKLGKNISASMLAYELAHHINPDKGSSAHLAALGGVADWCEGTEIEELIRRSKEKREFLKELYYLVEYEIYQQKFFHQTGSLFELLDGPKQKELMQLYAPILEKEKQELIKALHKYTNEEKQGDFTVHTIESDDVGFWGDYFAAGKIAGILHQEHEDKPSHITMVLMSTMIVFRASQTQEQSFDVNEIITTLQKDLPYARISGGGHDVAGSMRFARAAKEEIVTKIKEYIATK